MGESLDYAGTDAYKEKAVVTSSWKGSSGGYRVCTRYLDDTGLVLQEAGVVVVAGIVVKESFLGEVMSWIMVLYRYFHRQEGRTGCCWSW